MKMTYIKNKLTLNRIGVSQNIFSQSHTIDPVVLRGVCTAFHNTIIQASLRWKDGKSLK